MGSAKPPKSPKKRPTTLEGRSTVRLTPVDCNELDKLCSTLNCTKAHAHRFALRTANWVAELVIAGAKISVTMPDGRVETVIVRL